MFDVVKAGESATRGTTVDGDIATIHHVTLNKGKPATKDAPFIPGTGRSYAMVWTFDFTGVTRAELIDVATGALTIAQRPKFKHEHRGEEVLRAEWEDRTFSVRDILDEARRVRLSKLAKAAKAFTALSDGDKAALLAWATAKEEEAKEASGDEEESE